jgi:hypothetical protein
MQYIRSLSSLFYFDRPEDDSSDDHHSPVKAGVIDDRHTRHIIRDDRFLSTQAVRRRFEHLGNFTWIFHRWTIDVLSFDFSIFILVKNDRRCEQTSVNVHDDSVLALISHAAEERLKCIIEQIRTTVQQRVHLSSKVLILLVMTIFLCDSYEKSLV